MGICAHRKLMGKAIGMICLIFTVGVAASACAPQIQNHGYLPPQEDLDQIKLGVDTRSSIAETVGAPSAGGVVTEGGMFYVRSQMRTVAMFAPQEVDRQVVAISFNGAGTVSNVERFGLERGKVVPLARRVTTSSVGDKSFLRQLLGNIGRFNPAGLGG